jgi:hypothetical protein
MALSDMEDGRPSLEQSESAFLVDRNLTERNEGASSLSDLTQRR